MRITCPNCTASFEIPTELLGKKGRSLKCASCGHSWYQTPHVETIDLAEIMGQEYAARARAAMGPASSPAPAQPQARPGAQAAMPGQPPRQFAVAGAVASPLGVSMLNRRPGPDQPGQTAQSWLGPGQAPPGQPGAQPRPGPPAMTPGPSGPPAWYQPDQINPKLPPPPPWRANLVPAPTGTRAGRTTARSRFAASLG
jgi:predicted Zn finger-like uncharacterized protein